jgi:hypothetical protein
MWQVTPGITSELGLNVFFRYLPQSYTISGTAKRGDGTLIPGGVDLTLSRGQQSLAQQHSTDGTFSFNGVQGGVSLTVTPSANGPSARPVGFIIA